MILAQLGRFFEDLDFGGAASVYRDNKYIWKWHNIPVVSGICWTDSSKPHSEQCGLELQSNLKGVWTHTPPSLQFSFPLNLCSLCKPKEIPCYLHEIMIFLNIDEFIKIQN